MFEALTSKVISSQLKVLHTSNNFINKFDAMPCFLYFGLTAIFVISPSPAIIHTPTNPITSLVNKSSAITYFANGLFSSLLIESKLQGIAKH